MQALLVLAIVAAVSGVMFALQNNVPVTVNFVVWRFDTSLALALLSSLALGALMAWAASVPVLLKRAMRGSRDHKEIERLQEQLQLREVRIEEMRLRLETAPAVSATLPATDREREGSDERS